jgi:DNA-binding MarR family transcriptional regulator
MPLRSTAPTSPPIGPPSSPIGPALIPALMRIPVDMVRVRMIVALHQNGFTDLLPAHLTVLRYPGPDGRRPIDIAKGSGMSKQAINYHLGQLETLRYLDRREDSDDQRSKRVHLTDRGHAALATMRQTGADAEQEWAAHLGTEDIEQLRTILTRLASIITR